MFLLITVYAAGFAYGGMLRDQNGARTSPTSTVIGTAVMAALGVSHFAL